MGKTFVVRFTFIKNDVTDSIEIDLTGLEDKIKINEIIYYEAFKLTQQGVKNLTVQEIVSYKVF